MKVILDDLTIREFFSNGGVVTITKLNDNLKFNTDGSNFQFTECDLFLRFIRDAYLMNNSDVELVNSSISLNARIGDKYYTTSAGASSSIDMSKFYIEGIYAINRDLPSKDCWGIENVNFSRCEKFDKYWDKYKSQRLKFGFDDSELWNLDATIVEFIIPRLKRFIQITEKYDNRNIDELKEILKELIDYDEEKEGTDINDTFSKLSKYMNTLWY